MSHTPRIPARAVLSFLRRLEREDVLLHGFELRCEGEIQAEGYYAPFQKGEPHRLYSVSKSMVSLAVGLLEADGKLRLSDPLVRYFPEKVTADTDERLLRLTIRDMLRMATCHCRTTYREDADTDWASTFFTVPPTHEPGTVFSYDTSSAQVLGALCQRLSGEGLLQFLTRRVFAPIGADDHKRWLTDPSGVPQGGSGLMMSLRDLGKTAQLLLDGGRGLIPETYLQAATSKQIDTPFQATPEERLGYGYQIWQVRDGYMLYGMGGQLAILCPSKKMILCTIGDTLLDPFGMQKIHDAFFAEVYPAKGTEPDDEADRQALAEMLSGLHVRPLLHHAEYAEPFAPVYKIADPQSPLREIQFADGELRLVWVDGTHGFPYTLGEVSDHTLPQWQARCLLSAGFTAEHTLRLWCHMIGSTPCGVELLAARSGDRLTLQLRASGDLQIKRYTGFFWGKAAPADNG